MSLRTKSGIMFKKLLGIEAKVRRLQEQDPRQRNPLSVRMELQADCLAAYGLTRRSSVACWRAEMSNPRWEPQLLSGMTGCKNGEGPCQSGDFYTWQLATAHELVSQGIGHRVHRGLQYV